MSYIVIDDVKVNDDRLCFYFRFDIESGIGFAAKKQVNNEVSNIKSDEINDVIAWIGFDSKFSGALFKSERFSRKYKVNPHMIIEGQMLVNKLNGLYTYFIKENDQWIWLESIEDVKPKFQFDIEERISAVMGKDFINQHEAALKQAKELDQSFKDSLSTMRKLNKEISKIKNSPSQTNDIENARNADDFICSVS